MAPFRLNDVFDLGLLDEMVEQRYVKVRNHRTLPLRILNYTAYAQFDAVWNDVTRACRGLIVTDDEHVIARPFAKFFGLAETPVPEPHGRVSVTEKLDGSLGVLHPVPGGYAVATRGHFHSEQADHATVVWRERYADRFVPDPTITLLFEIVYPTNRVVVDYRDLDDIVLIGAIDIATGASVPIEVAAPTWPGPVVESHPFTDLASVLASPERPDREGFVVHFVDHDIRVKIKHDEYVRLHRLLTDVSERRVWEVLATGEDLAPWLDGVPDELYGFVASTRDRLLADHAALRALWQARLAEVLAGLPAAYERRDLARAVLGREHEWPDARLLFALADGKDVDGELWRQLRPPEHIPVFNRGEAIG